MNYRLAALGLALAACAAPAFAQDAPAAPITVSGSAAIVSDYSFRGISQSNKEMAVQAGITVAHESGFYVGTWGSNLAGWGTFGGANMELDLIGGYKMAFEGGAVDVGLTWYMYPGGFDNTDFAEPYIRVSGTAGPVGLTAAVAYAPKQQALGPWYTTGADAAAGVYNRPNAKNDNLYVSGDGTLGIPNTPITAKAHIGYSNGNPGLGPFATSVAPTGEYWDWMLGADAVLGPVTLGVAYVDTDISRRESAYLEPSFSKNQDGTGSIADGRFVFSLTAAF
ncbi:MAG: TorF family putative porin [Sphingomonas fennica]